jgi:hypothetical protein
MSDQFNPETNEFTVEEEKPKKSVKKAVSDASSAVSGAVRERADELSGPATSAAEELRAAAARRADSARVEAAEQVAGTARALHAAADNLDQRDVQQRLLHSAADGLMKMSDTLRDKKLDEMVSDIAEFGRRNPAAFLGGAVLAGFALARLARASGHRSIGVGHEL